MNVVSHRWQWNNFINSLKRKIVQINRETSLWKCDCCRKTFSLSSISFDLTIVKARQPLRRLTLKINNHLSIVVFLWNPDGRERFGNEPYCIASFRGQYASLSSKEIIVEAQTRTNYELRREILRNIFL